MAPNGPLEQVETGNKISETRLEATREREKDGQSVDI